jgi:deoxyadenosine/deoxycytidine kinase
MIVTENYRRYWLATAMADSAGNMTQLEAVYAQLPVPDLSIHFDADVDTAFDRILARSKGDHILRSGGKERLARLWSAYQRDLSDVDPYPTVRISTLTSLRQTRLALSDAILEATTSDKTIHDALAARPMPALEALE